MPEGYTECLPLLQMMRIHNLREGKITSTTLFIMAVTFMTKNFEYVSAQQQGNNLVNSNENPKEWWQIQH